jgi:subtilisin family serine protease
MVYVFSFCLFIGLVTALDVDPRVEEALTTEGYADVIILVEDYIDPETEAFLTQDIFVAGADTQALRNMLRDKKRAIRKQQRAVLREMNLADGEILEDGVDIRSLERKNVDLVLEERFLYVSGFSGILTEDGYAKIVRDPGVTGIYLNEELHLLLDNAVPFISGDYASNVSINGTVVTGDGIGVCVIDTGVDTNHSAIADNIVEQYCYCSSGGGCCPNGASEDTNAYDDNGHGTAVIGTIVSDDATHKGIAPDADIMVVKAFDSGGSGSTSDVLSAITKCIDKADEHNIKVFSFSFGGSTHTSTCDSDSLASVANGLRGMGFFVSAAAGNGGITGSLATPACGSNVTSVGSVYDNSSTSVDTVASFSNTHSDLALLAPGANICTSQAAASGGSVCYTDTRGNTYTSLSGTSFSAPLVAGAAALVAQYNVLADGTVVAPTTILSALENYGEQIVDSRNGLTFPRIDIEATLQGIDSTAPLVSFIDPTPADNALLNNTNVTINVSVSDFVNDIVLCKLAINGTNSTMNISGSGRDVLCSTSVVVEGIQTYTVFGVDNNGNVGATATQTLRMNNTAPTIANYSPENLTVVLTHPTEETFFVEVTDGENDVLNHTWKLNTTLVGSGASVVINTTDHNEGNYTLTVIADDGFASVGMNWTVDIQKPQEPEISNFSIIPSVAYYDSQLVCSYTFNDPNGDVESGTSIIWSQNNNTVANLTNSTFVNESYVHRGDIWACSVEPSDGTHIGEMILSENRTISNYAPELTVNGTTKINESEQVVLAFVTTDNDGDNVTVAVNDSRFVLENGNYTMNTTTNSSSNFSVLFNATDGYDVVEEVISLEIIDALDTDGDGIPDYVDEDDDNDGSLDVDDCHDTIATIYPGANDIEDNNIDEDCSGEDATASSTTNTAASGGGGGGGPITTSDSEEDNSDESSSEDDSSDSDEESVSTFSVVESETDGTSNSDRTDEESTNSITGAAGAESEERSRSTGLFALTGAAIGDFTSGDLSFGAIFVSLFILFIFAIIGGGCWYFVTELNKTPHAELALGPTLRDFWQGVKELFER